MNLALDNRRCRYALFVLLALAINGIDGAVMRSAGNSPQRNLVIAAAWFDMIAVVGALYYWLLVRPGIRGKWSILPVALAGLVHATSSKAVVAGLCELALIAFVVVQLRAKVRTPDPVEAIAAALGGLFPPRMVAVMAAEFGILYYALFSWRARPHVPGGARAFTIYKKAGQRDLLYAAALISLIEIIPAHILIHLWSPLWAWIATALSVYAAVWLTGLARSMELRPSLVGHHTIEIRYGLLFRLCVARERIVEIRAAAPGDKLEAVVLPRRSDPDVTIELDCPLESERLFGMRRPVHRVSLAVDDRREISSALAAKHAGLIRIFL
jgi:hypothetical protein